MALIRRLHSLQDGQKILAGEVSFAKRLNALVLLHYKQWGQKKQDYFLKHGY